MRDRGGNFAMMAALVIPVLLASGGVAIDMTNIMLSKNQLQDATDAAALAASSALINDGVSIDQAKKIARDFVKSHTQSSLTAGMSAEEIAAFEAAFTKNTLVDITSDPKTATLTSSKAYNVTVSSKFEFPVNAFTRLLGQKNAEIATASKSFSSSETKNAVSMFLVLDRSGSMGEDTATTVKDQPTKIEKYSCGSKNNPKTCEREVANYVTKIDALKDATKSLTGYFKAADPDKVLVRTGAVSYNASMQKQTDLAWGSEAVDNYVKALTATGGTDSGDAFETAYKKLILETNGKMVEESEHFTKNKQVPTKYIIFMTDGDNNYTSADTETEDWCDKARAKNIQVYTVAFMAPARGQKLLGKCATTKSHYFKAEDAEQLNAAFKYIGEKASAMTVRLTQ
jgi:Flp pilus assembly protein TadG/uncharacterized protein YegL